MTRFLLFGVLCVTLAIPVGAQRSAPHPVPLAPMVLHAPLTGMVTFVTAPGAFSINLGRGDQLRVGAELLIRRDGFVVGRAVVTRLRPLDADARLLDVAPAARVQTGDAILVSYNERPAVAPPPPTPPAPAATDKPADNDFWRWVGLLGLALGSYLRDQ